MSKNGSQMGVAPLVVLAGPPDATWETNSQVYLDTNENDAKLEENRPSILPFVPRRININVGRRLIGRLSHPREQDSASRILTDINRKLE